MIHQYKLNGYNIVLDVYSGSVHAVDELAYDAIALVDKGESEEAITAQLLSKYSDHPEVTAEEIHECLGDIETLRQQGRLFTADTYATRPLNSKSAAPWSRRSASTLPIPATSTAATASPLRASSMAVQAS